MLRWISENYRTFLWAFALAIAVWISAVSSADPDETRALRSAVPIQIVGQDPSLVISSDVPKDVQLTLHAPRSIWNIIEADSQSVRAILDLSGLSSGEHTLDLQIQIGARPVQVVSVAPRTVTLMLESLATQTLKVDVTLTGEVAIGYQVGDLNIEPKTIIVAGAQSQVEKVSRARLAINLNGIREDFDQTIPIEILDEKGERISGVSITPESVHVTLPVTLQGGYRDVAVKVVTSGRVASGYRMTDISVSPPVVTVFASDPQLVNALPGVVETQILDLRNAQQDIDTRVALSLPVGISIIGEQAVLIQVGVSPIESSVTLAGEKVEIVGLDSTLTAQVSPATVDVIVSGPLPVLDTLARQDVRVTVNLTGLGIGVHQVVPEVEALIADVIMESILPNTIEVVITQSGTPGVTPTP
jgi:YbbR domain-containing protein